MNQALRERNLDHEHLQKNRPSLSYAKAELQTQCVLWRWAAEDPCPARKSMLLLPLFRPVVHHNNEKASQPSLTVIIVCDFFSRKITQHSVQSSSLALCCLHPMTTDDSVVYQGMGDTKKLFRAPGHDC